jgi:hypothetical protein
MAAAGHDVAFIARGAHRDSIRRDGAGLPFHFGAADNETDLALGTDLERKFDFADLINPQAPTARL